MKVWDARHSAKDLESKFNCHKLRLANGKALVITWEAWKLFLYNLLTSEKT